MASKLSVSLRREDALKRLEGAMINIASMLGVDAPEVPRQGRDPHLLYAQQLETLAAWAESVVGVNSIATPYDVYTVRELRATAEDKGLTVPRKANKVDLIAMLIEAEKVAA